MIPIRPITPALLEDVVRLHLSAFEGYTNARLGPPYARTMLSWFARRPDTVALCAVDERGTPVGYVVGMPAGSSPELTRRLAWAALRAVARRPSRILDPSLRRKAQSYAARWLKLRRPPSATPQAPGSHFALIAIGVDADARGRGTGLRLLEAFEREAQQGGHRSLRLWVYAQNLAARRLYERCGWTLASADTGAQAPLRYEKSLTATQHAPTPSELRLLAFEDDVYAFDGRRYSTDESHTLFVAELGRRFAGVTLCSRISPERSQASHSIPEERTSVLALPYYADVPALCRSAPTIVRASIPTFCRAIAGADVLWLNWPHPLSLLMLRLARQARKPCVLVVRQNLAALVRCRYTGARRTLGLAVVALLDAQLKTLSGDCLFLCVGDENAHAYAAFSPRVLSVRFPVIPAAAAEKHAPVGRSRSLRSPLRLLFVGRLAPEKGLVHLVDALASMHAAGRALELDLVGTGPESVTLRALVRSRGLEANVRFHGQMAFGEPLFALYRAADLFVLPSLSEGVPKVIQEAMALGVPVLATAVGGIPGLVHHGENGWLVPPASSTHLAQGIAHLADNPELATKLARQAWRQGRENTIERRQAELAQLIATFVAETKFR